MKLSLMRPSPLGLGLVLVVLVGSASWWLAQFVPSLGNVTVAILLGVLVGNLPAINHEAVITGGKFAEKELLPISVALLGVELQLAQLVELGGLAVLVVMVSILTSIVVSVKIGAWLGFSRTFSLLIGAGNGICGSSAVASTSLAIKAEEAETGISIGVVNLLGTIGIFLMPAAVGWLSLNALESGLWIGGTLQAFGQVLAAGFAVSPEAAQVAAVVKMGRVLMLGVVVVWLGAWVRAQNNANGSGTSGIRVGVPRFIVGFFVMSLLASFEVLPRDVLAFITTSGKYLLVLAMAGIGMRIHLRMLLSTGLKALIFGGLVWLVQLVVTWGVISILL